MKFYYVYMLLCADGTYYTGVSSNVEKRLAEHAEGLDQASYTARRRPVKLVYTQEFQWVQEAIEWEKRLKKWSSKKKAALLHENWSEIQILAKCRNATGHEQFHSSKKQ